MWLFKSKIWALIQRLQFLIQYRIVGFIMEWNVTFGFDTKTSYFVRLAGNTFKRLKRRLKALLVNEN